jgi:hypothetical protein
MLIDTEAYSIPSTAAVTVLATPGANIRRVQRWLQIYNPAGNATIDVELRYNNGTITSRIFKKSIAADDYLIISEVAGDDAVAASAIDRVVHIALDNSAARVVEAVAGSAPAAPLQVVSSWGDYS